MDKIGLFYGSETGNTEQVAEAIQDEFGGEQVVEVHRIEDVTPAEIGAYSRLLIGCPTWYDGQLQSDWDDFFPQLDEIDFKGKTVALFGCGDQEGYAEYFVDAIGIICEKIQERGATVVGEWSVEGYSFEESKAVLKEGFFCGLPLDFENQDHLTESRIEKWVAQIKATLVA